MTSCPPTSRRAAGHEAKRPLPACFCLAVAISLSRLTRFIDDHSCASAGERGLDGDANGAWAEEVDPTE